ncbi:MAG: hypothetical protein AB8B86_03265 [Pseudomonadales bacterium]
MAVLFLCACSPGTDTTVQSQLFCDNLKEINSGSIDAGDATDIAIQSLTTAAMLAASPPSLKEDWLTVHEAITAWAAAITGEQSMLDTFDKLTASELVRAQGRITDYIATHCGLNLGGPQWNAAEAPEIGNRCEAWPRFITPKSSNHFPNLPDIAGSNYFGQNIVISKLAHFFGLKKLRSAFVVEPGGSIEFRGQYPKARYFAYHPNDMNLNNLPTLRDKDLEPDPGSINPFRETRLATTPNYYTARLVFDSAPEKVVLNGDRLRPSNTRYVGKTKEGTADNKFMINLMRMYHVDAGNIASSGDVPLPAMRIFDADGKLVQDFPECDPFPSGASEIVTERIFPAMPLIDNRSSLKPTWSTSSNFDAASDTMANADVQYVATTYSSRHDELLVIRAKYLTAPDTRGGEAVASSAHQVRLYNLCTYNFWNGAAIHCRLENELRRDEDGFYTIVASKAKHAPSNLADTDATWMDTGVFLDGQFQFRYVYRENPYVQAIAKGVMGEDVAEEYRDYIPKAAHCSKLVYEQDGWRGCLEP